MLHFETQLIELEPENFDTKSQIQECVFKKCCKKYKKKGRHCKKCPKL